MRTSDLLQVAGDGLVVDVSAAYRSPAALDALVAADLTDDPLFGRLTAFEVEDFFDPAALSALRGRPSLRARAGWWSSGTGRVAGRTGDVLVYADLARWEIQQRQRPARSATSARTTPASVPSLLYKRGFFVDWRVADRLKAALLTAVDFFARHRRSTPASEARRAATRCVAGWRTAARRPFRVVPFFDPAPWGGQWMRAVCDLRVEAANYGWCFDCVPEENSCCSASATSASRLPALDLVFTQPDATARRCASSSGSAPSSRSASTSSTRWAAATCRCRCTRSTEYIRDAVRHGLHAGRVLLPARCGTGGDGLSRAARHVDPSRPNAGRPAPRRRREGRPFPAEQYVNVAGRRGKHDHFLIPAGTVHCSGAGCDGARRSARRPYIFTFKLWDWGRLGLDGRPRPIHLDHGAAIDPVGARTALVRRATSSTASSRSPTETAGARSGPGCTSASSSRPAGTGSPARCRTTRTAASTCSTWSRATRRWSNRPTGAFDAVRRPLRRDVHRAGGGAAPTRCALLAGACAVVQAFVRREGLAGRLLLVLGVLVLGRNR